MQSSGFNMVRALTLFCIAAAGIVTAAYEYTREPIAAAQAAAVQQAIRAVAPPFDNDPTAEAYYAPTSDGDSLLIYPARMNGAWVGAAVESYSLKGFSGEIQVMVGFDTAGIVTNYAVVAHAETPGLGSRMQEWFRATKNSQSVIGRSPASNALRVTKDGGDIDAITAATISSRAFLDAINRAASAYMGADADVATAASHTRKDNPQ